MKYEIEYAQFTKIVIEAENESEANDIAAMMDGEDIALSKSFIKRINIWRCKMQIEINEAELKEWAVNQIRKRMGDRINTLMREWDWNGYMRDAVDRVVREKVTDEAVKCLMKNIDKGDVVRTVSDRIATEITDSLQNYHLVE